MLRAVGNRENLQLQLPSRQSSCPRGNVVASRQCTCNAREAMHLQCKDQSGPGDGDVALHSTSTCSISRGQSVRCIEAKTKHDQKEPAIELRKLTRDPWKWRPIWTTKRNQRNIAGGGKGKEDLGWSRQVFRPHGRQRSPGKWPRPRKLDVRYLARNCATPSYRIRTQISAIRLLCSSVSSLASADSLPHWTPWRRR